MRRIALAGLAAALLSACTLGSGPTGTPTLTSDQVLQTAQAEAVLTREAASPTPTRVLETATPTAPTATATLSVTATATNAIATADYNANVRSGPGVNYGWVDFFLGGQTATVIGRYESDVDGTWWSIRRIGGGLDGWVWGGAVTVTGDLSGVPYLTPPPTPTPGPAPTATPTQTASPTPT